MSSKRAYRVRGVELGVVESEAELGARVARELGLSARDVAGLRVAKKALDARRLRGERRLRFVYEVELVLERGQETQAFRRALRSGRVAPAPHSPEPRVERVHGSLTDAPAPVVVVGSGPAGLFAALVLARHGVRVTLIDRGSPVERRSREVVAFHRTRVPNAESNLLFGEGGAGTYSDGKLYTRVDDPLEHALLAELVACGAPAEILYDARAHIGTDKLHRLLPRLRERLVASGIEFVWNARLDELVLAGSAPERVRAVRTPRGEIACSALVLATGHSARDTWELLASQGVAFEPKPFQLGLRIEHPQELVTRAQLGQGPEAAALGAASYQLVARADESVRAAHSFCMCPGGRIVASVSEPGLLCTNGMSNSKHSSRWANAALVVTLTPDDFGRAAFDGVRLQRELEARFFAAGGFDYTAPAQRADDFLAGRPSTGELATSYGFGAQPGRLDLLVEPFLRDALRRALASFERSIPGFASAQGLFVGVESRSSGPVRMPRERESFLASGFANVLPVGEGAGWAGGIMSAALDGARAALALLRLGVPRA
jgi:uncharacterized protein